MKTKTYDHAVIENGVFYSANTPIPVAEEEAPEVEEKAPNVEEKAEEPALAKGKTKKAGKNGNKGTSTKAKA